MINTSRTISYLLRHNNEDLTIDKNGFVNVNDLIMKIGIDFEFLKKIVDSDNKGRYSFNADMTMIRANQGHSNQKINIKYQVVSVNDLPEYLYHGTSIDNLEKIKESQQLSKMSRSHVHLSGDRVTAIKVGMRHAKYNNKLVILVLKTNTLLNNNIQIYKSDNGVYLTDNIPFRLVEVYAKISKI